MKYQNGSKVHGGVYAPGSSPEALTLVELAMIVGDGEIEDELQDRIAQVIRSDPRFAEQFEKLEAMAADAGTSDLWEAFDRQQDFDRLLDAGAWDDPAEILNPKGSDLYEVNYRRLLAIADALIAKADDPAPIESVKERLQRAEKSPAAKAVYQVAEAVKNLSASTCQAVLDEALRNHS